MEYRIGGKKVRSLEALPVYLGDINEISDEKIIRYLKETLAEENPKKMIEDICLKKRCIKYNSLLKIDGAYYYLAGKTGKQIVLQNAMPLYLGYRYARYIKKVEKALATGYFQEKEKGKVIITGEMNLEIFYMFIDKLSKGVLRNKKNSILNTLINGRKDFLEIGIPQQCSVIMQIVGWMQLEQTKADMRLIGGSPNAGVCLTAKKISGSKEFTLISQSAAGLYENSIDLLKI